MTLRIVSSAVLLLCLSCGCLKAENVTESWLVFNITCNPLSETARVCQNETLEKISSKTRNSSDVQIDINVHVPWLQLNSSVSFSNLKSFVINGIPGLTTVNCSANAGIIMSDIHENVTLTNMRFVHCGSEVSYGHDLKVYMSALALVHCGHVEFNSVVITRSNGMGLLILSHLGGQVIVKSAIFSRNNLMRTNNTNSVLGGGGVFVQVDKVQDGPCSFHFDNCTFERNSAHTNHYTYLYTNILGKMDEGYGQGGGFHLVVESSLSNVHVSFFECHFVANLAFIGGGLSVDTLGGLINQGTSNITIEVENSLFEKNGCNYAGGAYFGGGMHLSFSRVLDQSVIINSHYLFKNVSFIENCAQLGGGVYYTSDQGIQGSLDNFVLFDNCTFKENLALFGSAVNVAPSRFSIPKVTSMLGYMIVPTFKNCYFFHNKVIGKFSQTQGTMQRTPSIGTVYASMHDINFDGHNRFESNIGTTLYVVNGVIDFQKGSAYFFNNTGIYGGAVALIGSSTMIIGAHDYHFVNNKATYRGGAMYVLLIDGTDFAVSRSCFVQYADISGTNASKWLTNVTFSGNHAYDNASGHAIYATSLRPCQVIDYGTQQKPDYDVILNMSEVFTARGFVFDDNVLLQPQIATDGAILRIRARSKSEPLILIPGQKHEHGVKLFDDLLHEVNTSFRVAISRNVMNIQLDPAFALFVRDQIQLNGKSNQAARLSFNILPPRESYISLKVKLVDCPPGFTLSASSECVCNVDAYVGLFKCNLDKFYSHLLHGYWAGRIDTPDGNEPKLATSPCPFCDYSKSMVDMTDVGIALPQNYSKLNKAVCGETRTGIVCGMCQDNYTVHFHSPSLLCKSVEPVGCRMGWLFYLLSELVPVTFVFISVLVLNISFTSGAINGFILFSQLLGSLDLDASGIIILPKSIKDSISSWKQVHKVLYGFLNLNFFNLDNLSFCLWKGASALDMLAFKYVTILFTLVLIVAVIWFINKCGGKCCGKCCRITTIRMSVVHGISTFLVICYAQCVKVSLGLLTPVYLYAEINSNYKPSTRVWLNGEIVYFSKEHLRYAIPALLSLLTIGVLPPALLLMYPAVNKIIAFFSCEKVNTVNTIFQKVLAIFISNLKPLLDSFQGCFKDNLRFFAGLYFLYRWIIQLIFMTTISHGAYFTTVGVALIIILTLHTLCQPYVKKAHNIIDTLLFTNLVLINFLSFFNYHSNHYKRGVEHNATTLPAMVQMILIYMPLIVLGIYLMVISCKKCGCGRLLESIVPTRASDFVLNMCMKNRDTGSIERELILHERVIDEDVDNLHQYFEAGCESDSYSVDTF